MAHDPKTVFEEFCVACERAWMDFELFRSVRDVDDKTLALYDRTAPLFFADTFEKVEHIFYLQCAKLTDPASSGKDRENLTSNFIVEKLPWSDATLAKLKAVNERLLKFRAKVEPARNKRIAHLDLKAQVEKMAAMGVYDKGDDAKFFDDLQELVTIAAEELLKGPRPVQPAMATDTHQLVNALHKAVLYDGCKQCDEKTRTNALLDSR